MTQTASDSNHLQPPISADHPPLRSDAQSLTNPLSNGGSEQAPVALPIAPIDDSPLSNVLLELQEVTQLMGRLQQADERRELRSADYQNLIKHMVTRVHGLVYLFVVGHLVNATFAVAGAAMLKTNDGSYQLGEAALTATLGTLFIHPLCLFLGRALALEENPSMKFKYLVHFSRLAYYFLVPITGYALARHVARLRMNLSQHLGAYGLGTVTLFIPVTLFQAMVLWRILDYWGYFRGEDSNRSTLDRTHSSDSIDQALPVAIASGSIRTPPNQHNASTEGPVYDQSGQTVRYPSPDVSP